MRYFTVQCQSFYYGFFCAIFHSGIIIIHEIDNLFVGHVCGVIFTGQSAAGDKEHLMSGQSINVKQDSQTLLSLLSAYLFLFASIECIFLFLIWEKKL